MMAKSMSRRELLQRGVKLTAGAVLAHAAVQGARAADKVCVNLDGMDSGAKGLRTSLNYTEASPDTAKTCSVCAFFQGGNDGCGTCMIFNGPANAKGRCDSWSQKS